ncbi:MAG: PQQ-like beta-propeller repeat protein [Planctomycetes bacterium]|nr:PQQ-like beta-propeller repeat protein [Planctomycetota bacterium]
MLLRTLLKRLQTGCAVLLTFGVLASVTSAENWPQWRGPTDNGISNEKNLPAQWSRTENVAWRLELPGVGQSTPAVWGERIFLTVVRNTDKDVDDKDKDLLLLCIGTNGKELWRRSLGTGDRWVREDEGNRAAPSPMTDGRHVWAMMTNGEIACFTVDGKKVWQFNLQDRYGKFQIQFGMTSTPVLYKGRLYLQLIHGIRRAPTTDEASVLALDALTGKEIWKRVRKSDAYDENKHSYASPFISEAGKEPQLITHGADYLIAYRVSDGKEVWRCGGLNPQNDPKRSYHKTLRFVASPTLAEGMIVIPTAKREGVYVVRADFQGDITDVKEAHLWSLPTGTPDVPNPLIHNGLVYLNGANGNLACHDAKTGKQLYFGRTHRQRHRASPVYADGKIYVSARDGKVTVVKAGPKFEVLAVNDFDEELAASPAISNGTIYYHTFDALWAIRK